MVAAVAQGNRPNRMERPVPYGWGSEYRGAVPRIICYCFLQSCIHHHGEEDMKTLCMKVDDSLYSILLAMLNGLPKDKITILETGSHADCASLMRYAGSIAWPVDGVEYQRQFRDEEW